MQDEVIEKHQLAGLDERERGFNRQVEIDRRAGTYRATFRYETTVVATERQGAQAAALTELVVMLHARGYQQLRSRLSFQGGNYLGSQEAWIEYPDPAWVQTFWKSLTERIRRLWAPHT
jgi:hypothetical protein